MLLALLRLVDGRLGGALEGPVGGTRVGGPLLSPDALLMLLILLVLRNMGGVPPIAGPGGVRLSMDAILLRLLTLRGIAAGGPPGGGDGPALIGGALLLDPGGGGVPEARGGGGVALFATVSSAPAFLLTQRFWSGS